MMARQLRVAVLGARGVPATYGGVERHVEEIGARVASEGHEVVVYSRDGYGEAASTEYRGMQVVQIPTPNSKHLEAFAHTGRSAWHARRHGFDVVHYHALGPGLFAPLSRTERGTAVVQTIHGRDDRREKWSAPARTALRAGWWLSARVPHETIVVSQDLLHDYAAVGRTVTPIPNGTPEPEPRPPSEITRRWGLRGGDYALFLGRLVPEKDPIGMIEAFAAVPTDTKLVVVGGSSHTDEYAHDLHHRAARDDRVIATGYQYGNVLQELLTNAKLFVQPSLLEGLPLTLLEATAYGLPVLASDIPPHREVLKESAPGRRMFPAGDRAGLSQAIAEALADPQAAVGAAALQSEVRKRYSWDSAAEQVLQTYHRALDKARDGSMTRSRRRDRHVDR